MSLTSSSALTSMSNLSPVNVVIVNFILTESVQNVRAQKLRLPVFQETVAFTEANVFRSKQTRSQGDNCCDLNL